MEKYWQSLYNIIKIFYFSNNRSAYIYIPLRRFSKSDYLYRCKINPVNNVYPIFRIWIWKIVHILWKYWLGFHYRYFYEINWYSKTMLCNIVFKFYGCYLNRKIRAFYLLTLEFSVSVCYIMQFVFWQLMYYIKVKINFQQIL